MGVPHSRNLGFSHATSSQIEVGNVIRGEGYKVGFDRAGCLFNKFLEIKQEHIRFIGQEKGSGSFSFENGDYIFLTPRSNFVHVSWVEEFKKFSRRCFMIYNREDIKDYMNVSGESNFNRHTFASSTIPSLVIAFPDTLASPYAQAYPYTIAFPDTLEL